MPISENEAVRPGSGSSAWASDWIRPDQFELAAGQEADADRRPHQGHVGDLDPPREQREIAQMRAINSSATTAGSPFGSSPSSTLWKVTVPEGNSEIEIDAAQHRLEAGDGVNFRGRRRRAPTRRA